MMGYAYSTFSIVIYPMISRQVPEKVIGTAFGVCSSIQNISTFLVPPTMGFIKDNTTYNQGYFWVEFLMSIVSLIPIVLITISLKYYRKRLIEEQVQKEEIVRRYTE